MITSILALALAYVFLLFILLLAILRSEIGVGIKLTLTAFCLGFYLWHYDAMKNYLGWPTDDVLPQRFELVSSITVEPDLKGDEPGGIFVWVLDLDREQAVPRAYRLPYQKPLHRKIDDTLKKQRQGQRHIGSPVSGGAGKNTSIEFKAVQRESGKNKSSPE